MLEKLKRIIMDFTEIPIEDINISSNIISDLQINSIDLAQIILSIEKEFEIDISDSILIKIHTVSDLLNIISCDDV